MTSLVVFTREALKILSCFHLVYLRLFFILSIPTSFLPSNFCPALTVNSHQSNWQSKSLSFAKLQPHNHQEWFSSCVKEIFNINWYNFEKRWANVFQIFPNAIHVNEETITPHVSHFATELNVENLCGKQTTQLYVLIVNSNGRIDSHCHQNVTLSLGKYMKDNLTLRVRTLFQKQISRTFSGLFQNSDWFFKGSKIHIYSYAPKSSM